MCVGWCWFIKGVQIKHTPPCIFLHAACCVHLLCLVGRLRALLMWNSRSELHVETPGLTTEREVPPPTSSPPPPPLYSVISSLPQFHFSQRIPLPPVHSLNLWPGLYRQPGSILLLVGGLTKHCISSALDVATRTKVGFQTKIVGTGLDKLPPPFQLLLRIGFILSCPVVSLPTFTFWQYFHDSAFEYGMNQGLLVISG